MQNESNLTEYRENRRRMSSQLNNMCSSISQKFSKLQESNGAFDYYVESAKRNRNIGNLSEEQRFTELARNQKLDIVAKLASVEADINTRTNLARQAQKSLPGSDYISYASVHPSHLSLIDISRTYINGPY